MPMGSYKFQFRYSLERDITDLYIKASVGGSGALTILNGISKGIASITRNSAGNYTIVFNQPSFLLLEAQSSQLLAGGTKLAAPLMKVEAESVNSASSPSLQVQFYSDAGAAADIDSGAILMLRISVRDAST